MEDGLGKEINVPTCDQGRKQLPLLPSTSKPLDRNVTANLPLGSIKLPSAVSKSVMSVASAVAVFVEVLKSRHVISPYITCEYDI